MQHMQILLIEDENQHCLDYKNYISTLEYPISFFMADGEAAGLDLVQKFPFDIIILDLELHESDGDGLEFLKKLKLLNLPDIPYIIVISNNNSPKTRLTARERGADYIFWKGKNDYCPKLVVDFARNYYQCKVAATPDEPKKIRVVSLEEEIRIRITKIGVTDDMTGKKYLVDSIAIVAKSTDGDINLQKDVYPVVAKKHSKSEWSVIKAMELAIKKAWSITDQDTLAENYTSAVSGSKGNPTNKEFIFYYANQVKDLCKA